MDIRRASRQDLPALPDIERRAGSLFLAYVGELGVPSELFGITNTVETFAAAQQDGRLWVATTDGTVVGFALVVEIGGYAHIEELDVLRLTLHSRPQKRRAVCGLNCG